MVDFVNVCSYSILMTNGRFIKSENTENLPARTNDWAEDTLHYAADRVEVTLQPPARGQATARTLREIAAIIPAHTLVLDRLDLAYGMDCCTGRWQPAGDARVTARRQTCRDIEAAIAVPLRGSSGNYSSDPMALVRYLSVLLVVIERWYRSADPRLSAIAETATREARELIDLVPYRHREEMPLDSVDRAIDRSKAS